MAVLTDGSVRFMLDNVFNYVPEDSSFDEEYWWATTWNKQGWVVAWLDKFGVLETVHSNRYPPEVWGGLEVDSTE